MRIESGKAIHPFSAIDSTGYLRRQTTTNALLPLLDDFHDRF
jgi:hypothetical protein